jgi:hypothetical protein
MNVVFDRDIEKVAASLRGKWVCLPVLAFYLCGCDGKLDVRSHQASLYFGSVRDVATRTTLSSFCAEVNTPRAERIVFSASAGQVVEEEVLFEMRSEDYRGGVPPQRDERHWCTTPLEVIDRWIEYWICLRTVDADPPASIVGFEPRGTLGVRESSSGYALKLEVHHPGVLNLALGQQCLREHAQSPSDPVVHSPPFAELTIQ